MLEALTSGCPRPTVEDIELGYRLRRAGYRLRLDPRFRGKHLKKWTVRSSIIIEIRARGIPWTQLIHRYGALTNDLNTRHELRWSVVLAYVLLLSMLATPFVWAAGFVAVAALGALIGLNAPYLSMVRETPRLGVRRPCRTGPYPVSPV